MITQELSKYIPDTGIILILGHRGSGKSVLAYSILEYLHQKGRHKNLLVYNFPKPDILPDFIQPIYDINFPENSAVLIDEAYIEFSARSAMSKKNKVIDMLNGLARQKDLLIIYITQDSTRIDINIIRSADVLMIKRLSKRQVEFERKEIKKILKSIKEKIDYLKDIDIIKKSVYIDIDMPNLQFSGLIKNCITLPKFWNDNLSKAWRSFNNCSKHTKNKENFYLDSNLYKLLKEMKEKQVIIDACVETNRFKVISGNLDKELKEKIIEEKNKLIYIFDGIHGEGYNILSKFQFFYPCKQ